MPPPRSKFIIGSFVFIRTIIYMLLVKPWEYIKGLKKQTQLLKYIFGFNNQLNINLQKFKEFKLCIVLYSP